MQFQKQDKRSKKPNSLPRVEKSLVSFLYDKTISLRNLDLFERGGCNDMIDGSGI